MMNVKHSFRRQPWLSQLTRFARTSTTLFTSSTLKQRNDVLRAVEGGTFDFALLDTRGREPFAGGHIPGALCVPIDELETITALLPRDKEIVTYCWSHD